MAIRIPHETYILLTAVSDAMKPSRELRANVLFSEFMKEKENMRINDITELTLLSEERKVVFMSETFDIKIIKIIYAASVQILIVPKYGVFLPYFRR